MATKMQQRRDTAANWASTNPVLDNGVIGFEYDTGQFKIGNGTATWNNLPYAGASTGYYDLFLLMGA